jgi:hypothetical protein
LDELQPDSAEATNTSETAAVAPGSKVDLNFSARNNNSIS